MSIFRTFYLNKPEAFASNLPVDLFGGGGDGGAAERAERDRREQKAKEARITRNISLIDVLFANDPSALETDRLALTDELAGFGPAPPNPFIGGGGFASGISRGVLASNPNAFDPNATRRTAINKQLGLFDEASGFLEGGPTKSQREGTVISDVQNFFFDDLNEQRDRAGKDIRFELSRRGGFGGSQELDALGEFQKKEDRARLDIGNVALDARNNLRSQDAQLKSLLIDQANRDIQTDILTSQFTNNLGQGLAQARDTAKLTQFDPFFETAGNLFSNVELIRGDQLGRDRAQRQLSFFSANPSRNFGTVRS